MQRFRATTKFLPLLSGKKISPHYSSGVVLAKSPGLGFSVSSSSWFGFPKDPKDTNPFLNQVMSVSTSSCAVAKQGLMPESGVEQIELLRARDDIHGGVVVDMDDQPMDSDVFASLLKASLSEWRQKEKKGVWIKLPIELSNLVHPAVKEGFTYHHAESDYIMLKRWLPETVDTLPANASHRVGIGAFIMNSKREVLVVQEINGRFKDTGIWKMPTGAVNEGEDICAAAVREVKEETGIETEFVEILAFRHSHKSFFRKSDLFFVCMLKPQSFDIQEQNQEIAAAQWMPFEDYAAQPFVKQNKLFDYVADICLAKTDKQYTGFTPLATTTSSGKASYLYFNNRDMGDDLLTSDKQQ
uniref:nudix hydrolase 2-like isoform X1 n=2 Tax=Fragaria vesca subsp. vesca TaxID=101020 RepID=UPI0005C9F288|nr:PREDICTED: nudix hydrolase 2-like isoform X1 [Fragaria vesca subsp. vesca]